MSHCLLATGHCLSNAACPPLQAGQLFGARLLLLGHCSSPPLCAIALQRPQRGVALQCLAMWPYP